MPWVVTGPPPPTTLLQIGIKTDMPETRPHDKKLALQLSTITGFQILVSFLMQWYVITYFGAGVRTDALYTGATIPQLLTILVIESLTVVIVPMFATSSEAELEERGWFLFVGMGILFLAISAILFLALPVFIPLIVPGFSPVEKQLTVSLARIHVFGLVGAASYAVLASMYQARERFIVPPAATLFSGIGSFVLLAWQLPRFGVAWAAWMQVFNITLPGFLLLPALCPIRRIKPQRELIRTIWSKMRPLLLSKAYYMTNAPLDRILASFLAPGSIAIFELAGRFYNAVIRILSQGVVTPFIPHFSRLAHEQNWAEFRTQYRKQLVLVSVPSAVVMAAVIVGGGVGLRLLPSNSTQAVVGSLNVESLSKLFRVMVYMSGLLPCMAFVNSLVNGYYAKGDTRTPTVVGVCAFTVGMGVKIAGYYAGGILGMALAVSAFAGIYCLVLYVILELQTNRLLAAKAAAPAGAARNVLSGADVNPSAS